jgi:hypothetical protein
LVSGEGSVAVPDEGPGILEALDKRELSCVSNIDGITSATAQRDFRGFPLCLMNTRCTVNTSFNFDTSNGRVVWEKGQWMAFSFACRALEDGGCPAAKECAKDFKDRQAPFRWIRGAVHDVSIRQPGDSGTCNYDGALDPRALIRAADKDWKTVDAVCASRVRCNPAIEDQIAVCAPRRSNLQKYEFVCPSAMDCVAERFPLDKPKANVAAQPPRR